MVHEINIVPTYGSSLSRSHRGYPPLQCQTPDKRGFPIPRASAAATAIAPFIALHSNAEQI